MRRSPGALMLAAALLAGCANQPAARPDPTPLTVYVYVTPEPSTGTTQPDSTPLIVYVTPAPTPAPTPRPTPKPTPRPTPTPKVLPSLTVFYVTPKPTPKSITFTMPPTQSEDAWSPYFYLNGQGFTINYVQTGEAICIAPYGILLPKGVIDDGSPGSERQRTYWSANLSCASGSKSTDVMGDPLKLAAGNYHMWLPPSYNTLTITITQP